MTSHRRTRRRRTYLAVDGRQEGVVEDEVGVAYLGSDTVRLSLGLDDGRGAHPFVVVEDTLERFLEGVDHLAGL